MRVYHRPGIGGLLVLGQAPTLVDRDDLAQGAHFCLATNHMLATMHGHAPKAQRLGNRDSLVLMTFDGVMGQRLGLAHFDGQVGHVVNTPRYRYSA